MTVLRMFTSGKAFSTFVYLYRLLGENSGTIRVPPGIIFVSGRPRVILILIDLPLAGQNVVNVGRRVQARMQELLTVIPVAWCAGTVVSTVGAVVSLVS